MNNSMLIQNSEKKYLQILEAFFIKKWGATKLWSHDLDHHRRVWNYAKELLQYTDITDQLFIDKLLIACYLHDIGMATDPGEKHGIHSRKYCEEFLEENKISPADHADLLQVIEIHDNKDYFDSPSLDKLFFMLSVADDLDAFGYIGICRYFEIYTARGIDPGQIAPMVLKNASIRYNNFVNQFNTYPLLIAKQRSRYLVLTDFFHELDSELSNRFTC